jgi:hypothetical protein
MHEAMTGTGSSRKAKTCTADEWIEQVGTLHRALEVCPADLNARRALATLLEELQEWDGALFNWRRILAYDPNSLDAWEGMARCRKASHDQGFPDPTPGADLEST